MTVVVALAAACVVSLLLNAAPAAAGVFQVKVCDAASTTSTINWGWRGVASTNTTVLATDQGLVSTNGCPTGGDSNKGVRSYSKTNSGTASNGHYAALVSDAPLGTTFTALTIRYRAQINSTGAGGRRWRAGVLAQNTSSGASALVAGCADTSAACDVGSYATSASPGLAAGTNKLLLIVQCRDAAGCPTNGTRAARAGLGAAWITVTDTVLPTISGVSGRIASSTLWLRGNQYVTWSAADSTGIVETNFLIDGSFYWDSINEAACENQGFGPFTKLKPCPDISARTSYYPTTAATNGAHNFKLFAMDPGSYANTAYWPSSTGRTFYVDNLAPAAPTSVSDGSGVDIDWQSSTTGLSANWPAAADTHSGVGDYRYCFSTSSVGCGGTILAQNWTTATSVSVPVTLTSGTRYYACVYSRDRAVDTNGVVGNVSGWRCSDGVTVDTAAPAAPLAAYDSTGADIDWQNASTSLSANWTAGSDASSGVRDYYYCLSTSATGCAGTIVATGYTAAQSITRTALTLAEGTRYYACIRTRDNALNLSAYRCTDGVTVDLTPPATPTASSDGTGTDIDWQSSTTSLSANWTAGSDTLSGVRDYYYCLSTSATGCAGTIVATGYTAAQSITRTALTLAEGTTYYACIRTRDNALNLSTTHRCSDGVTVDGTAPTEPTASSDGTGADIDWQASATSLSATWTTGSDTLSGVRDYQYCFSTLTGCAGTIVASGYTTALAITRAALVLAEGQAYFACIRTRDNALNLSAYRCSDGNTVDTQAPSGPASVDDGSGADIDWQSDATSLAASWPAASDAVSGVRDYDYCFSTATGCAGTIVGNGATVSLWASIVGVALAEGVTYHSCVRARDNVGNVAAWTCSDAVTVDATAPTAPDATNDGTGTDIDWQASATSLSANWTAASDATSGIREYDYCFSTAADCAGAVVASGSATTLTVTRSGLALVEGQAYYACARSRDNALNLSGYRCSDGVTVDSAAPAAPSGTSDGTGADIDWQAPATSLSANWTAGSDPLSGVRDYQYCFSTLASCGGTVVARGDALGTTVTRTDLGLVDGQLYFACIRTRDNALNVSAYQCSDGVTVDTQAPTSAAPVNDGSGADIDAQTSLTRLDANWIAASDVGSGLASYEYCAATAVGCTGAVLLTGTTTSLGFARASLQLSGGQTYFACVTAVDLAGNRSTQACSNGVRVDGTLTLSVAGYEAVDIGAVSGSGTMYSEARVSVATDNPSGYTLSLHDGDGGGAMSSARAAFPWNQSGTPAAPAAFVGTGMAVSAFGGGTTPDRWCSGGQARCATPDDADLLWASLAGAGQAISGSAGPVNGDVTRIPIRITAAVDQAAGSYSGTIAIAVTANP